MAKDSIILYHKGRTMIRVELAVLPHHASLVLNHDWPNHNTRPMVQLEHNTGSQQQWGDPVCYSTTTLQSKQEGLHHTPKLCMFCAISIWPFQHKWYVCLWFTTQHSPILVSSQVVLLLCRTDRLLIKEWWNSNHEVGSTKSFLIKKVLWLRVQWNCWKVTFGFEEI